MSELDQLEAGYNKRIGDPMLDVDDMDLAEMLGSSLKQVSDQQQQLAVMIDQLGQMMQMLSQQVERLGAFVTAPRQVMRDMNGRPIGVRIAR